MFALHVRASGFEFLEDNFGTLEKTRHFNFSAAKGLRIMILAPSRDQPAQMFAIRENFIALLNVLKWFPRLQYLETMLVSGDRNGDWWPETPTDSMNVGFPDYFLILQPCRLL